jgi:hypothetical protein
VDVITAPNLDVSFAYWIKGRKHARCPSSTTSGAAAGDRTASE